MSANDADSSRKETMSKPWIRAFDVATIWLLDEPNHDQVLGGYTAELPGKPCGYTLSNSDQVTGNLESEYSLVAVKWRSS